MKFVDCKTVGEIDKFLQDNSTDKVKLEMGFCGDTYYFGEENFDPDYPGIYMLSERESDFYIFCHRGWSTPVKITEEDIFGHRYILTIDGESQPQSVQLNRVEHDVRL